MKKVLVALYTLIAAVPAHAVAATKRSRRHAVAHSATPVLNTPDFAAMFGGEIALDPCRGVRPVEFVALPGTLFRIEAELEKEGVRLFRVSTNDYPYPSKTGLFVDARFVSEVGVPRERQKVLPEAAQIKERLMAALGKPYVWGGNLKDGVPLLKTLYPSGDPLAGVDCSGLLYEATDGFTPRNTSALIGYGEGVPVCGLSPVEIAARLKPLDLLVYDGHVMVVLDGASIIESRMGCEGKSGVMLTPVVEGIEELTKTRQPKDVFPEGEEGARSFVVRRWL